MTARIFVILLAHAFVSNCVTVNLRNSPEINSKSKIELTPFLITSGLNDIVVLSAPIVNGQAVYYLHGPNGDALQLNLKDNKTENININHMRTDKQFKIFSVNNNSCCDVKNVAATVEVEMTSREFMIGPLQVEDHGNWVLSAYFKDLDEDWIELFQVITIEIIETVPLSPEISDLNNGESYVLSFAYPLSDLESCQIVPPKSTVDRYFDRTKTGIDKCEFIMKNVTLADEGSWTIIGVGRIVYKGNAFLHIRD